jgi:ABC-2 type transport system ATP-binding protein
MIKSLFIGGAIFMSPETIVVEHLSKTYQVPEREGGFGAAVRSFFKRKYKDVKAVQQVDFKIAQGEVVGFLGPNGAGKTTTLKMLSGLLHPTGGKANVLGFIPWELKPEYLRSMTLVMGQRNRLGYPRRGFVPAQPGNLPASRRRIQANLQGAG